jgi:hypothetical protein
VNTEEFGKLFESFRSSAFRLETLPEYRVPQDLEPLRMFREGKPQPAWHKERPWLATVREAAARGARMQRVRLVQRPLTEYQRFQFSWGYTENSAAGEEIAILDHEPAGMLRQDYWLFDDELVVVLEYDDAGRFVRPVTVTEVAPYCRCRDLALASAMPFPAYLARMEDRPSLSRPH